MLDLESDYSLSLPDSSTRYFPRLALGEADVVILDRLMRETPWRHERITLWGRPYLQPRLTAWYGDPQALYSYSGLRLEPLPWTATLRQLKDVVEHTSGARFNSVLVNLYRDQNDRMGFHSDDEPELGAQPVIASVSLGAVRTFILRHRRREDLKPVRLPLASGSLLLMSGETQRHWKHGIDQERHPCGPRVNLTFRTIHPGRVQALR